jgi:transposase
MTWQPKNLTREQMAERRAEGMRLLQTGKLSQAQIARHLGVSEAAVSKWKKTLEAEGPEALEARQASGRPPKLNATEQTQLMAILEQGALAAGFPTEQWTLARVKQVIQREFDVRYHRNYLSRLLHRLGWSVQKPETRALERDEELIRAWLRKDWPRIKKGAADRRSDRL